MNLHQLASHVESLFYVGRWEEARDVALDAALPFLREAAKARGLSDADLRNEALGVAFADAIGKTTKDAKEGDAAELLHHCLRCHDPVYRERGKTFIVQKLTMLSGLVPDAQRAHAQQPRRGSGMSDAVAVAVTALRGREYGWEDVAQWIRDHDWDHDADWQASHTDKKGNESRFRVKGYTAIDVHYETHSGKAESVGIKKLQEYIREAAEPR